jgi:DnaK suppressor protein
MMDTERLTFFRELLEQRLQELLGEADKTRTGMTGGPAAPLPDPTDRAALETDRNFELRIRDRERRLIFKIREAMERIEDGSYGVCEICGGDIGEKRLIARPVTTMCIRCKSHMEELERIRRA